MKNFYFFDMDGTLTKSKTIISDEMVDALVALSMSGKSLVIISGATREQMNRQLYPLMAKLTTKQLFIMSKSGTECDLWKHPLTTAQKVEAQRHIHAIEKYVPLNPEVNLTDQIQDRGSQISYSFLGHNADLQKKAQFDPNMHVRRSILKAVPFHSLTMSVRIGGTTCLDYTDKRRTKGLNIAEFLKRKQWEASECIYFGDALQDGGNDETVKGVIDCIEVGSPRDTLLAIKDSKK